MKEIRIITSMAHTLTRRDEERLLGEYNEDDSGVIRDVREWQLKRYSNLIEPLDLISLPPNHFVIVVLQMLWEKQTFGYPWKPYKLSARCVDVVIGIKQPPRPRYGNWGDNERGKSYA